MCYYLAARCLLEANELPEALQVLNGIDGVHNNSQSAFLADTQKEVREMLYWPPCGRCLYMNPSEGNTGKCFQESVLVIKLLSSVLVQSNDFEVLANYLQQAIDNKII